MIKWTKDIAFLIGDYSDHYFRGLFYSNVSFRFHFYCFVDSVVFFTSSETSLHWYHSLVAGYLQCKVKTDALQGDSVLHMERFRGYCYISGLF